MKNETKSTLKVRLLLVSKGRILLLHQTKRNGGNYTLVGGTIEKGEFARETLVRESIEEAGVILDERDLELAHVLHKHISTGHRMTLYFRAKNWDGFPHTREPHKFKKAAWYDLNDLPENLTGTVRHVLEQVRKEQPYSEYTKSVKKS